MFRIAGVLLCILGSLPGARVLANEPADKLLETGRRIYEQGIRANGRPLIATNPSGFRLEGKTAACTNCHRPSGMGQIEGILDKSVLVPPISGQILFAPALYAKSYLDDSHHYVPNKAWARVLTRPAYTPELLARALRKGIDSAGRPLTTPMFRYDLNDDEMNGLIAYLGQLTAIPSPGVDNDT